MFRLDLLALFMLTFMQAMFSLVGAMEKCVDEVVGRTYLCCFAYKFVFWLLILPGCNNPSK